MSTTRPPPVARLLASKRHRHIPAGQALAHDARADHDRQEKGGAQTFCHYTAWKGHDDLTSAMMERAELPVQMAELDEVGKRMPAPAFSGFRGDPLANITPASGL